MRDELQMIKRIADAHRSSQATRVPTILIAAIGILSLTAEVQSEPTSSGTPSGSDRVLPHDVIVAMNVVNRFFSEVTHEAATGQNATAVANPKATRSLMYANSDNSKKVTISVDQYASTSEALSAYEAAVQKSKTVPGFKLISVPDLHPHTFVGTVTQGSETHVGMGALDGMLIVGVTLAGYEPTPQNIAKLIQLTRIEQKTAKKASGHFNRN